MARSIYTVERLTLSMPAIWHKHSMTLHHYSATYSIMWPQSRIKWTTTTTKTPHRYITWDDGRNFTWLLAYDADQSPQHSQRYNARCWSITTAQSALQCQMLINHHSTVSATMPINCHQWTPRKTNSEVFRTCIIIWNITAIYSNIRHSNMCTG